MVVPRQTYATVPGIIPIPPNRQFLTETLVKPKTQLSKEKGISGQSLNNTVNLNPYVFNAVSIALNTLNLSAFFSIVLLSKYLPRSMARNEPIIAPIHTATEPRRIATKTLFKAACKATPAPMVKIRPGMNRTVAKIQMMTRMNIPRAMLSQSQLMKLSNPYLTLAKSTIKQIMKPTSKAAMTNRMMHPLVGLHSHFFFILTYFSSLAILAQSFHAFALISAF